MKLFEEFNIVNASRTAKDGHEYKIAYIDPKTSENTFAFKDAIKQYGAKFFGDLKAWGWYLGANPDEVYHNKIQPCLEYLTSVENNGAGTRQNQVAQIIDGLIEELSGDIQSINLPNATDIKQELIQFKADLLNCVSSEEFKKKLEPIIKFKQAQGHACSFRNAILIICQDPKATMVKSKTMWYNMNRMVMSNAKPILLWRPDKTPMTKQQKDITRKEFLQSMGVSSENELNPGQREELRVKLSGDKVLTFKTYFGYDVRFTQTIEGKEDLVGDGNKEVEWYDKSKEQSEYVENLVNASLKMIQASNVKINYVPLETMGGALGVSKSGQIDISDKPEYTQNYFDTIIHEFSHELLHQTFIKKSGNEDWARFFIGKSNGRGVVEQQAEISAWIVTKHFGLDRETSLNYAASWGMDANTAAKVFDTTMECAEMMIKTIEKFLKEDNDLNGNENGEREIK